MKQIIKSCLLFFMVLVGLGFICEKISAGWLSKFNDIVSGSQKKNPLSTSGALQNTADSHKRK